MADAKICKIDGCGKNASWRGWCNSHYIRWQRYGDPLSGKSYRVPGRVCSVDGCGKKYHANGYCASHEQANRKYGDPLYRAPNAKREWLKTNASYVGDDCLIWPFHLGATGRGCGGRLGEKRITAARAMCIEAHGHPPLPSYHAAHSCGNGHLGCVNPMHLRWATPSDNAMDRVDHGTMLQGEEIKSSKLTAEKVLEIRRDYEKMSGLELAELYGVSYSTIYAIINRKTWAWVKE